MEIPYGYCKCGCGNKTWIPPQNHTFHGWVKGVPRPYMKGHGAKKTVAERLQQHTVDEATGCWLWPHLGPSGYGRMTEGRGKSHSVHRFYYTHLKGPIPAGYEVDHLCRNPACCNPDHLEAVTGQENTRRSRQARLNPEKVREIRKLAADGWLLSDIGPAYGISPQQAGHVAARKSWADVT